MYHISNLKQKQEMDILEWMKKQTGKLVDTTKDYKFYIKSTPDLLDSSTTLTLTTFANRDQLQTVPCLYRWFSLKNGLKTEVEDFKGNSYICQPSDIGSILQAEITSTDPAHPGTAILQYGPVKMDVNIKRQIQNSLTTGNFLMNVDLMQKSQVRECQIKVSEEQMKINHCNSSVSYLFEYNNLTDPRIEPSLKQPTKISLIFSEKHENEVKPFLNQLFGENEGSKSGGQLRFNLKFQSRNARDSFLYTVKAFNAKKSMKNGVVVSKIQNMELKSHIDFMLHIDSLKEDIVKLGRLNDKFYSDKCMYIEQIKKCEQEIQQIITTYTRIAENKCKNVSELDQSVMELRDKKDEVMERKINILLRENESLRDNLQYVSEKLNLKSPSEFELSKISQNSSPFLRKKPIQQGATKNIDTILENLNESDVKEQSELEKANRQKVYLAKKLNESIRKVSKLDTKVKELMLNQTVVNNPNISSVSIDTRLNMTEANKSLSEVRWEKEKEKNNPELTQKQSIESKKLKERIEFLKEQIKGLQQKLRVSEGQKQKIKEEKASLQEKWKKKLNNLSQQNSMYRKNQDALNRSQNISMEMESYNLEQNNILKEQNQLLSKENLHLTAMMEKYLKQAKQIPKLKQQILALTHKLHKYEFRETELELSKSNFEEDLLKGLQ